jgi:hypothetical protein
MSDATTQTTKLLDAAFESDSHAVRECAIRRVVALRRQERTSMRDRLGDVAAPRQTRSWRALSPEAARLIRNLEGLGVPMPTAAPVSPAAERVARTLLGFDAAALESVIDDLGRIALALLCRDLDRGSASRLLRRAGPESARLGALAVFVPERDDATLQDTCRRLAAAGTATGAALVRALGRDVASATLARAASDTAAAVARRAGIALVTDEANAAVWTRAATRLLESRRPR